MRVYIVDDDPLVRRMIARMLPGEAYDCVAFERAATFLAALDTLPFGCVLLDVGMPDHNGLDVLTEVLDRRAFPVVMVSGSTDMNDAIRSFRSGAVHFVRKPFDREALLTTLAEAERIGRKRQAEADRCAEASRIRLTAREKDVLGAMIEGQQTKSIAWRLGLSVRTVDMHRSNILTKLRATNASQAVSIARALQLLPDASAAV